MRKPSFTINARMVLELGAELISSDGVALYELIKNSVDAGSKTVRISIQNSLRYSSYAAILDKIDAALDASPAAQLTHFGPLQREIQKSLEEDITETNRLFFSETVETASTLSQMRAALVRFYNRANLILVDDQGEGMSLSDLTDIYLTIGTRSRRSANLAAATTGGRSYLGEKGVGRLSTMRLGDQLDVITTKAGEKRYSRLLIDWDDFNHDSDLRLEEVRVKPRRGAAKVDPSEQGTAVRIRHLRSDWSLQKFQKVIVEDFSRLIDPFVPKRGNRLLRLYYNGKRHYVPELDQYLFNLAHAHCSATFSYDSSGSPSLRGFVNYRLRGKERAFVLREPELRGVTGGLAFSAVQRLGPFMTEFWWFNRQLLTKANGVGNAPEVREMIKRWSGGLMLFRGQYRINPYGGPEDDWLSLDKKAFSSRGFKLNRQQVIGRVVIGSENRRLVEQTNREGLTDTPEKQALIDLLQHVLFQEFKSFLDTCDRDVRIQELTTLENLEERIEATEDEIAKRVREVVARVPAERKALDEIERLVGRLHEYIDQARALAEEYQTDRAKFVYLAGIGLMVEFILHELGRATAHTLDTLRSFQKQSASGSLPAAIPAAFRTLTEQLETIVKRVDTLDPLSTSRRQQREEFDVFQLIRQLVESRSAQTQRHGIKWEGNFDEPGRLVVNAVRGMLIQIIENLISNSIYWLGVQRDIDPNLVPTITIEIDIDEQQILFSDNGTGVDPSQSEAIFEAFVSHRPARDGKGLGLYISREIAGYHGWKLSMLPESTTRKDRYNTFVLDLSGGRKPKVQ
ncbi:ATP-binding protein [Mesorhizobium sp. M1060]|uniref:sensor histidine kinase n=1 Tax=Mesorhizobium sp. M1060 TaxID=2957052 RepID=UPI00333D3C36